MNPSPLNMLFRVIQDDESSSRDLARARGEIADHSRGPPAAPSMAGRQSVYLNTVEAAAARYSVKAMRIGVRDSAEIAPAIDAFATEPDGGVIVEPVVSSLRCPSDRSTRTATPAADLL